MPIQNFEQDQIESARKLVNVAKERIDTETEFHAEPKQMPDRVTFTVNGEHNNSSSSANSGHSAEHGRRLAVRVTWNLTQVHLGPDLEEFSLLTSPLEPQRNIAVPSTISTCFLLSEIVVRVVHSLHMDSSCFWNGFLGLVDYPLLLREPWSLLCVDLFCSQFHMARQSLTLLFISVLCGGYINPGSLQYRQSSKHLWISNVPSPLPSSPPSLEKLNLVYPS